MFCTHNFFGPKTIIKYCFLYQEAAQNQSLKENVIVAVRLNTILRNNKAAKKLFMKINIEAPCVLIDLNYFIFNIE